MDPLGWPDLIRTSPEAARTLAHFKLVSGAAEPGALDDWDPEAARVLVQLLSGSHHAATLLARHPDWLGIVRDVNGLQRSRRKEGLRRELSETFGTALEAGDFAAALNHLHHLRQRELLRIAARDLGRLGTLPEILLEISNAADVYLDGVFRVVWRQLTERFGTPYHQDADGEWQATAFCVLGLGKLGGQELNYSSDVDLLFVYMDEGTTFRSPPRKGASGGGPGLANHQFFRRLGEAFIKEGTARGAEAGSLRIDMRLRPEGDSGPLARSLDSYENFYAEWGQTWERMMLLKARCVAGSEGLAGEFLEVIQPFRYPRSLGEGLLREMAEMKARIEREIVGREALDRNVKLGTGGIREIEFIAQSLQVLHGGRIPFLQTPQTLAALPKLTQYHLIPGDDADALIAAYHFLRDVEHRLQMDEHRQTHTLPEDADSLDRIARLMGFPDRMAFAEGLSRHTRRVRAVYDRVLGSSDSESPEPGLPADFERHAGDWKALLAARGFREPEKGWRLLRTLVEGPGFGHVSRRTGELGRQLVGRLLEFCPGSDGTAAADGFRLSDPDRVVARLDSYIGTYGARASLYELWTARPNVFAHIIKLFDRSEFLAELAIREPDIVDQLEVGAHLSRQKNAEQTLADLRHGLKDDDQHLWLRRYFQTEFMRLGLRDILGYSEVEQANRELSALAEACVEYAVEVVAARHGLSEAPFAIIALGKFGGAELVYGSDLDVIFVAPNDTADLPRLQKLASEVIDLLSSRTPQGTVFELDARLRPDGQKGLLVNVVRAYEDYYRQRAMLWEIQALTRARAVAGHLEAGRTFIELARRLTDFHHPSLPLAALVPDWEAQIHRMRMRIQKERTPAGRDALAFKTGIGGLIDAEFLAQCLALKHGWFEPNTLSSLEQARNAGALTPDQADTLIAHFRKLRGMESVLRRWSFEGEAVLPEAPQALLRVAIRCGFNDADSFLTEVARWRAEVRTVYNAVLTPAPS